MMSFSVCSVIAFACLLSPLRADVATTRVQFDQAEGVLNQDLAGVSLGGGATTYTNPVYTTALEGRGVSYVRLETITADHRGLYDPATDTWDWTQLEAEIESIQARGAKIIANIFYTPRFLAYHDDDWYFYSYPKDYEAWERYVEAIVRHVNGVKGYGIRYWEIGNEASGKHFFRAPMSDFWAYYESSARAVKRADPTAQVGGIADNPDYPVHYRNFFDAAAKSGTPIDFLTFHWYASWSRQADPLPTRYARYAVEMRELARERLGRDVPLFLTEWNYVGERPTTPQIKIGAYVAASLHAMQNAPIDAAFLFRVQPYRDTLGSLFDGRGEIGMVGRVFRMFTAMPAARVKLETTASGVSGLASRSEEGLAVWLARFDPAAEATALSHALVLAGHGLRGSYQLTVRGENPDTATHYGELPPVETRVVELRPGRPLTLEHSLAPYSVAFFELKKVE